MRHEPEGEVTRPGEGGSTGNARKRTGLFIRRKYGPTIIFLPPRRSTIKSLVGLAVALLASCQLVSVRGSAHLLPGPIEIYPHSSSLSDHSRLLAHSPLTTNNHDGPPRGLCLHSPYVLSTRGPLLPSLSLPAPRTSQRRFQLGIDC